MDGWSANSPRASESRDHGGDAQKITAAPSDPLADLDWAGFAREALSTEPAGCLRMALAGAGSARAACALAELALEAIEKSGQPDPWGAAEVAAWVVEVMEAQSPSQGSRQAWVEGLRLRAGGGAPGRRPSLRV